jgi:hypothetical protein
MPSAVTDAPDGVASEQQALVATIVARPDLHKRLNSETRARYNRVRKTIGCDPIAPGSHAGVITSALAFGVYRALIQRFSVDEGIADAWWRAKRLQFTRHSRDHGADHDIIATHYPEFAAYVPRTPLTDDEIITAAKQEFRLQIAAAGTDYGDGEAQLRSTKAWPRPSWPARIRQAAPRKGRSTLPGGLCYGREVGSNVGRSAFIDFFDEEAQSRVEDALVWERLYDERNVFGLSLSRVAALALRDFGTNGLFWLAEWLFFRGKYTELLRVMGVDAGTLGVKKFEALKRDMVRKLPQIHEHMMAVLRTDPEMLKLKDEVWGDTATEKTGETRFGNPPVDSTDVSAERARSLLRQRTRFISRVASDPEVAHLAKTVAEAVPATGGIDPLLVEFNRAAQTDLDWRAFKQSLLRRFPKAA